MSENEQRIIDVGGHVREADDLFKKYFEAATNRNQRLQALDGKNLNTETQCKIMGDNAAKPLRLDESHTLRVTSFALRVLAGKLETRNPKHETHS